MKTIALSVAGTNKTLCQDSSQVLTKGNIILGAWADGAGSAEYSHIGSQLVVETVTKELSYLFGWKGFLNQEKKYWSIAKTKLTLSKIANKALVNLTREAKKRSLCVNQLHTTLGMFVCTPSWIACAGIGDGFLVVRFQGEEDYQLLLLPDKGQYANSTYFLTMGKACITRGEPSTGGWLKSPYFQVLSINKPPAFICASTDGLDKVALQQGHPFGNFFKSIEYNFTQDDLECSYLKSWLSKDKYLTSKCTDDRTLILVKTDES